jgi:hypothetical protein
MRQRNVDLGPGNASANTSYCWILSILWIAPLWLVLGYQSQPTQAQENVEKQPTLKNRGIAILQAQQGPFPGIGVGQVLIAAGQVASDATVRIVASEKDQRIFYPAIEIVSIEPEPQAKEERSGAIQSDQRRIGDGTVIKRLRKAIERVREYIDPVEHVRIHFLFVGDAPLTIEIDGEVKQSIELVPQPIDDRKIDRATSNRWTTLLDQWWISYVEQAKRQIARSDYPSLVERYLVYSLANRFGFPIPELDPRKTSILKNPSDPTPTIQRIAGSESSRDELRHEQLTLSVADTSRRVAIPNAPRWKTHEIPDLPPGYSLESIPIEPIANVIPPECFYIRFGSFQNYLWFQKLGDSRGGDIAQLAMMRGYNYESTDRVERLLNTKMTTISKLFGDAVISDMAIVGYDLYIQDGPTMGVLFEAKNFGLLKSSFEQERLATLERIEQVGGKLRDEQIGGTTVSFLSAPDQSVRSFMVLSEPYLFVTSSRELARRFIEVQQTQQSLAYQPAFRFARLMMPLEHDYDVFAYFSSEFFQNLVSPKYQIELKRRMRAIAALENAELANIVAKNEKARGLQGIRNGNQKSGTIPPDWLPGDQIEYLIAQGYLPRWFQQRVDGSETVRFQDGWYDSLRGARGSFMPIADVPLVDCTPEESADYRESIEYYTKDWQQTDPLMFGLRRYEHPEIPKAERVAIEAYIAPLGSDKYGWMSLLLAPPVDQQIQLPSDDVVSLQVHLRGNDMGNRFTPNHTLFAGLKDIALPFPEETKGLFATLGLLKSLPVYLGAWPKPAILDRLPLGLGGGLPDVTGYSRTLIGLWRWQMGGFSIISFHREILDACASIVRVIPADDVAQGRLRVGNISDSKVAGWFNTLGFRQAAQATRGNLFLLDSIAQQLGLPPQEAKTVAQRLLDAKLQCTLGGEYQLEDGMWQSTRWPDDLLLAPGAQPSTVGFDTLHTVPPKDYRAGWLEWFRGANLHLTQLPERLVVVGHLDMELMAIKPLANGDDSEKAEGLPKLNFDIYNLPFKMFNSDKPKKKPQEPKERGF